MAAKEDQSSIRSTMNKGSDEAFELPCDPCSTDNQHLEAIGYCPSCSEYLCQACFKYHSKLTATKHHKLLDKSSMPKTKVTVKVNDQLTEPCHIHPDKLLEYICNVHDELGCAACMTVNHAMCQDKSYVPDVSDSFIENGEWKLLYEDLDNLVSMATDCKLIVIGLENENSRCLSKCMAKINSLRQQIDVMVDKLQRKAEQDVKSLYQENMDEITKASVDYQTIISELQNGISKMETKARDDMKNQLYVDIKLTKIRATILNRQLKEKSCRMQRYEIGDNDKLQELESTLADMLTLSGQHDGPVTKARYLKEINVKSDHIVENDSGINGIAVLVGDRVVATDEFNNAVKLIDTKKNNKIISRVPVTATPRDVTLTGQNNVAVTLNNNTIVLMNVTHVLTIINIIKVPKTDMYGICSYQDHFLVSCRNPSCLKIIDMSGKVIKTLDKNMNGDLLVSTPSRVAMNSDQTLVYITDKKDNTVTTMTMDGKIERVYESTDLNFPVGVTVGRYGEVFLCSHKTHTIHQLSPTGQYTRLLLGKDHELAEFPFAIDYSVDENKLYISSGSPKPEIRQCIRVFQLE